MDWTPFKERLPPDGTTFWATDDPKERGIRMCPVVPVSTVLGYYPHLKYWRQDDRRTPDRQAIPPTSAT